MKENDEYLTKQIITYLGNKRSLLSFIDGVVKQIKKEIGREEISTLDLFSGSGIVARYFKTFASKVYANDLEGYSKRINSCYLMNKSEINEKELEKWLLFLEEEIKNNPKKGFISEMYSPKNDEKIQLGERVFYTTRNALYIDTARQSLEKVPEPYKTLFLASLIYEASVKNNTSGVFKGFYKNSKTKIGQFGGDGKNALKRIKGLIKIQKPILSKHECEYEVFQEDANALVLKLPHVDLAYFDPPYNQHPYSSNYFMLNLINDYKKPEKVSKISGIPEDWNKSVYNKKNESLENMKFLCEKVNASYVLISFNSEGFISKEEMVEMLKKIGQVEVFEKKYNTFRGCRNLSNREKHVKEYLFLLRK